MNKIRIIAWIALFSVIGNLLFSFFIPSKLFGIIGWSVALCWFPYELLRGKVIKKICKDSELMHLTMKKALSKNYGYNLGDFLTDVLKGVLLSFCLAIAVFLAILLIKHPVSLAIVCVTAILLYIIQRVTK